MKKFLSAIAALTAVIMLTTLAACGEKEVTTEEAYEQLTAALTNTVTDADQLSVTLKGSVNAKIALDGDSSGESGQLEEQKYSLDLGVKVTADDDRYVNAGQVWLKVTEGDERVLDLEAYLKDGYTYAYFMLQGLTESYTYDEADDNDVFDLSEIDSEEIKQFVEKFTEVFPEPTKATVKGKTYTLTWKITNENLPSYVTAVNELFGGESDMQEVAEIAEQLTINKGDIQIIIDDGTFKSFVLDVDAAMGEQYAKAKLEFNVAYKGVKITVSADRLEQIKNKAEEDKETPQGGETNE
ncbi:MAG: hypothetical protein IJU84_03225 [Clostridia bacterium]|nr:hypothetical protein [Clostridia bacterium]